MYDCVRLLSFHINHHIVVEKFANEFMPRKMLFSLFTYIIYRNVAYTYHAISTKVRVCTICTCTYSLLSYFNLIPPTTREIKKRMCRAYYNTLLCVVHVREFVRTLPVCMVYVCIQFKFNYKCQSRC